jgi:hypothetical protein
MPLQRGRRQGRPQEHDTTRRKLPAHPWPSMMVRRHWKPSREARNRGWRRWGRWFRRGDWFLVQKCPFFEGGAPIQSPCNVGRFNAKITTDTDRMEPSKVATDRGPMHPQLARDRSLETSLHPVCGQQKLDLRESLHYQEPLLRVVPAPASGDSTPCVPIVCCCLIKHARLPYPRTSLRIAARTPLGSCGHTSMTIPRSGSLCTGFVSTAPRFAPTGDETGRFPRDFRGSQADK